MEFVEGNAGEPYQRSGRLRVKLALELQSRAHSRECRSTSARHLYSLGATLWKMRLDRRPFRGASARADVPSTCLRRRRGELGHVVQPVIVPLRYSTKDRAVGAFRTGITSDGDPTDKQALSTHGVELLVEPAEDASTAFACRTRRPLIHTCGKNDNP